MTKVLQHSLFPKKLGTVMHNSSKRISTIFKSKFSPVQHPEDTNISDFVWSKSLKNHGEKIALVDGVTGKKFRYDEASEISRLFGQGLDNYEIQKGDVVAVCMPNCPEYFLSTLGVARMGGLVTTINPSLTPGEISRQMKLVDAKIIITMTSMKDVIKKSLDLADATNVKICYVDGPENDITFDKVVKAGQSQQYQQSATVMSNDTVLMPFSSGTTGLSKGVMLTHGNLVAQLCQLVDGKEMEFIDETTETFQPSTVNVLPLFHIFGYMVTGLPTLYSGAKFVSLPGFEPQLFIKTLEKYKPSFLHLVPPLVSFCVNQEKVEPRHLSSLKHVQVGAAPIGKSLIEAFHKKNKNVIFREGYGMTELSPVATMAPGYEQVPGSCGLLVPNTEAKIVSLETGEPLGTGQPGELCIRGPQVMKGYFSNPEATENAFYPDNWLRTGDIAYCDEEGRFFIVDRFKELIKVKSFQVPPAELENLIRSHEMVADVAVIGVPNERYGEVPKAYIVRKTEKLTEEEVVKFVEDQVAEFKRLRGGVEFIDVVPKSAAGKILRRELAEAHKKSQG